MNARQRQLHLGIWLLMGPLVLALLAVAYVSRDADPAATDLSGWTAKERGR